MDTAVIYSAALQSLTHTSRSPARIASHRSTHGPHPAVWCLSAAMEDFHPSELSVRRIAARVKGRECNTSNTIACSFSCVGLSVCLSVCGEQHLADIVCR